MRAVWMSVIAKELHTHTKLAETGSVVVASLSRISDEARQRGVLRAEMKKMKGPHLAKSFLLYAYVPLNSATTYRESKVNRFRRLGSENIDQIKIPVLFRDSGNY